MDFCEAKTRSGSPCRRPAEWGTPRKIGRCKLHGGRGGAPKDNKNALKHGLYEALHYEVLDEAERSVYHEGDTDPLSQTILAFRILMIREARILKRLKVFEDKEAENPLDIVEGSAASGYQVKGPLEVTGTVTRRLHEDIMVMHNALSTISARKTKLIELINTLKEAEEEEFAPDLMEVIRESLENLKP